MTTTASLIHLRSLLIATTLTSPVWAGEMTTEPAPLIPPTGEPDAFEWLTPSLDLRTRYEYRDQDGSQSANALTGRARAGLLLGDFGGFSAFGELEATAVAVSDYRSNPTGDQSTYPYEANETVIADPRNFELNRAWLQYENEGFLAKVGRQRIIRNGAAFIGNVGWRQNEQTFDAAQIAYKNDHFSVSYAYSNRVQRIFGEEANDALPGPPLHDFEGEFHFLDGSYTADFGKVGGYAYLIDVDNNGNVGESNSFGLFTEIDQFYAEFAFQEGESNIGGDYDAVYGHVKYSLPLGNGSLLGGLEYLGDDFKTPFATVHAYNGFADAFILDRIGLRNGPGGTYEGLSDLYLSYTQKDLPGGLVAKGFLHYFADDSFDETYGYEADLVLVKKFSENLTGLLKGAYFVADDSSAYPDIKQVSLQLDYKF
jgi:hypothetical protein